MRLRKYVLLYVIIIIRGIASEEYITLLQRQFIMDGCGFIVAFPMRLKDRIATKIQEKTTSISIVWDCIPFHCIGTSNDDSTN